MKKKLSSVQVPKIRSSNVLDNFLGEMVLVFLDEHLITEDFEGHPMDSPIIAEGILYNYDNDWILLGNEEKTVFSSISKTKIIKIDSLDKEQMNMLGKPDKKDFN